ncbi:zinc-containing alcohol dehydrogenase superfamily protein [Caballeronia hypogeia]|uniref:Zinc-containing alcohol dehydrogenase superfamily protein n=1 Tax=Caballeronia hypogeia TaxID=1777140 RepID=A0A158D2H1_9BURK|nr:alcohol dehydrogenase family protein [Caballeronia hypogeia]SAK88855.1 zinc-containing alcohol dehydrogenase superfamily protein [Caballeronia hypogeia]
MSRSLPDKMHAVLLTGLGGFDKLEYRTDVPVPKPKQGEVLIQCRASAVNNTDINTRIGWYSKSIDSDTGSGGKEGFATVNGSDASWSDASLDFPRIQGADCCGYIVAVGEGVSPGRIGERVLVSNLLRSYVDYRPFECWTFGSECDGGFAQFTVAPARETLKVDCDWTDAELASIPCSNSTAENMLHRVKLGVETVLVTGASGGVGSAAVQLAKRRGAHVIALSSPAKAAALRELGADRVLDRNADLVAVLGENSIDVVIDVVGGEQWPKLLKVLRLGGRYAIAGAIAGPISRIDLRTLYLKDLTLMGCTFQEEEVFRNLISYIEKGEIRPLVAKTFPLKDIRLAQEEFLNKGHLGKLVLNIPEA